MNDTKVHFITGNPNVGKTTTAWLIYLLLKEIGKVEYFHLFQGEDYKYNIPEVTEEPACEIITNDISNPIDFCALIIVGHVHIFIMSPGDNGDAVESGFKWVKKNQPEVFIGCSRSHFNSYARCKLFEYESSYNITLHRLYRDYADADCEAACKSRLPKAKQIVDEIISK